jgi:hypothetical protein
LGIGGFPVGNYSNTSVSEFNFFLRFLAVFFIIFPQKQPFSHDPKKGKIPFLCTEASKQLVDFSKTPSSFSGGIHCQTPINLIFIRVGFFE